MSGKSPRTTRSQAGSFHGQWVAAWGEVAELQASLSARYGLRKRLTKARELIDEDNDPRERRCGGQIIREVRQEARWLRDA